MAPASAVASSSTTLDPTVVDALRKPKERKFLLQLEDHIVSNLRNEKVERIKLTTPISPHYRFLVHLVCDYFGLGRAVDEKAGKKDKATMTLFITANSHIPERTLTVIAEEVVQSASQGEDEGEAQGQDGDACGAEGGPLEVGDLQRAAARGPGDANGADALRQRPRMILKKAPEEPPEAEAGGSQPSAAQRQVGRPGPAPQPPQAQLQPRPAAAGGRAPQGSGGSGFAAEELAAPAPGGGGVAGRNGRGPAWGSQPLWADEEEVEQVDEGASGNAWTPSLPAHQGAVGDASTSYFDEDFEDVPVGDDGGLRGTAPEGPDVDVVPRFVRGAGDAGQAAQRQRRRVILKKDALPAVAEDPPLGGGRGGSQPSTAQRQAPDVRRPIGAQPPQGTPFLREGPLSAEVPEGTNCRGVVQPAILQRQAPPPGQGAGPCDLGGARYPGQLPGGEVPVNGMQPIGAMPVQAGWRPFGAPLGGEEGACSPPVGSGSERCPSPPEEEELITRPAPHPVVIPGKFKIMQRKGAPDQLEPPKPLDEDESGRRDLSRLPLEEREQVYLEARARIFGETVTSLEATLDGDDGQKPAEDPEVTKRRAALEHKLQQERLNDLRDPAYSRQLYRRPPGSGPPPMQQQQQQQQMPQQQLGCMLVGMAPGPLPPGPINMAAAEVAAGRCGGPPTGWTAVAVPMPAACQAAAMAPGTWAAMAMPMQPPGRLGPGAPGDLGANGLMMGPPADLAAAAGRRWWP